MLLLMPLLETILALYGGATGTASGLKDLQDFLSEWQVPIFLYTLRLSFSLVLTYQFLFHKTLVVAF